MGDTGFLAVEILAVYRLFGTVFIDASVKLISPEKKIIYPISSAHVTIKGTDYENCRVAQVGDMAERRTSCRVAKDLKIPAMQQVPVLIRASAIGP